MNDEKICGLCKRPVLPNDNYVRITDYSMGKFFLEKFYHTLCYNNKLKDATDLGKMKKQTFELLRKAREKLGMDEVVKI